MKKKIIIAGIAVLVVSGAWTVAALAPVAAPKPATEPLAPKVVFKNTTTPLPSAPAASAPVTPTPPPASSPAPAPCVINCPTTDCGLTDYGVSICHVIPPKLTATIVGSDSAVCNTETTDRPVASCVIQITLTKGTEPLFVPALYLNGLLYSSHPGGGTVTIVGAAPLDPNQASNWTMTDNSSPQTFTYAASFPIGSACSPWDFTITYDINNPAFQYPSVTTNLHTVCP